MKKILVLPPLQTKHLSSYMGDNPPLPYPPNPKDSIMKNTFHHPIMLSLLQRVI